MNIHLQTHAFLHQIIRSIQDFIGFSQDHIVRAIIDVPQDASVKGRPAAEIGQRLK